MVVVLLVGCGGRPGPYMKPGVRERAVAPAPVEHIPTTPDEVPRPGHVRFGVTGGVQTGDRDATPARVDRGQHRSSPLSGEAFVAVGMPGAYTSADEQDRAGWELAGGAIATPTPAYRNHALDGSLVAPARGAVGGYMQITGTVGSELRTVSATLAIRALDIPFVWDYGDCAGGRECTVWNRKGAPVEGSELAWGASGSFMVWNRFAPRSGLILGIGFDVPASIELTRRDDVMCDANGNCTGGMKPSAPESDAAGFHSRYMIGADVRPVRWLRVSAILAYAREIDADDGHVHVRTAVEATF